VNDIESDINLFADDTSLMNIIEDLIQSYAMVNTDLSRLSRWADQWLVTYNAKKTVSLYITNRSTLVAHPILTLNNTPILEVQSHCHLGVDFESRFSWQSHILRIAGKAAKCVGLMRRACRELPRSCLENLYLTMVRPILEYGGILFDGSPLLYTKKLDAVQREAALVCTGAYKHTKTTQLMTELGWNSLQVRRIMQKLVLMYKIQKNLAPQYLVQACPPLVGTVSDYNLRNAENIVLPQGRLSSFFNSFMPSSIRAWNNLDCSIKNRCSLDAFKYHLKKSKAIKKVKLYSKFNGVKAINHTRIRLGLSGLKAQRHDYHHVLFPTCDYCGARKEDAMHFLLQCATFANMRIVLINKIMVLYMSKNIVLDLRRTLVQKELVNSLLKGDVRLSEGENTHLFMIVQEFILATKRF
jgi:hypothetical protein